MRRDLDIVVRFRIANGLHGSGEDMHVPLLLILAASRREVGENDGWALWTERGQHKGLSVTFFMTS